MQQKPEIEFPVKWNYKIIVNDVSAKAELEEVLSDHGYSKNVTEGNASKTGKFQAYRVSVTFNDQESMDKLSKAFGSLACVKFML